MSPGPRLADLVDQLVDDETIVILERRRHAQAVDTRDLEAERHDQHRVHDRDRQRLQARQNLAAHPFPFREWVGRRIGHDRSVADRGRCQLERVAGQMLLQVVCWSEVADSNSSGVTAGQNNTDRPCAGTGAVSVLYSNPLLAQRRVPASATRFLNGHSRLRRTY